MDWMDGWGWGRGGVWIFVFVLYSHDQDGDGCGWVRKGMEGKFINTERRGGGTSLV